MILSEKERAVIEDLQTQEKSCVEKYGRYAQQAKDPELKALFQTLQEKERTHYTSLANVLKSPYPKTKCRMLFLQQTVSLPKNWYPENTTLKSSPLAPVTSVSFLLTFR